MIRVLKVAQFPFIMLRLRSFGPSLCLPLKMLMMKLVLPWTLGPISFQGFDWPWLPSTLWPFSPSAPFQCPCSLAIACLGPQQAPWQSFLPPNPSSHLVGKPSNRSNTDKVLPIGVGSDWITILPNLGQKSNTNVKPLTRLCKDSNSSNMLITAIENQQPDPCLRILVVCRQRPRIKGHGGRISRLAEAASPPAWPLSAWAAHLKQVDGDYMRGNPFLLTLAGHDYPILSIHLWNTQWEHSQGKLGGNVHMIVLSEFSKIAYSKTIGCPFYSPACFYCWTMMLFQKLYDYTVLHPIGSSQFAMLGTPGNQTWRGNITHWWLLIAMIDYRRVSHQWHAQFVV